MNEIYLRRAQKVIVPEGVATTELSPAYIATILKNLEAHGYIFTTEIVERLKTLTKEQAESFYKQTLSTLKAMLGANRKFRVMYPNFPTQVMDMSDAELYLRAIFYYQTGMHEEFIKDKRLPLVGKLKLKDIKEGSVEDYVSIMQNLAKANTSLSVSDKADLKDYIESTADDEKLNLYSNGIPKIPNKENFAFIAEVLTNSESIDETPFIQENLKTATDILRYAVSLSGGDVSLKEKTAFLNFSRAERRRMLSALEAIPAHAATEDILRWKMRWVRLGEKLHAGDYLKQFPNANAVLNTIRDKKSTFKTFGSRVETAIADGDVTNAVKTLKKRSGEFARRLDKLIRTDKKSANEVLSEFSAVAKDVSTPVLLQVLGHFKGRNTQKTRFFMPKGNTAKVQIAETELPKIGKRTCNNVVKICNEALKSKFAKLPELGKVYVDESLKDYIVPFSQRSASKALRTLVRGTKINIPDGDTLRFFIWWKDGTSRTDIDLSAVAYNEDFKYLTDISYYNLKSFGGYHSGDITSAPHGASEFIDVNFASALKSGARYIIMTVNSFTQQPYCDLPECFAGWMIRESASSGEIYEPKTVQDKVDLASNTTVVIPVIFDMQERKAIWVDLGLSSRTSLNNAYSNKNNTAQMLQGFTELSKANLYELFVAHAKSRGSLTKNRAKADLVIAPHDADITPYDIEKIMGEFMQ